MDRNSNINGSNNLPSYLSEEILLNALQKRTGTLLEITDLKWKIPDLKGGHFVSAVNTLSVTTKDVKNGTFRKYHMFIKSATPDENRKEMMDNMNPTHKEVTFFNDILPTLQQFCKEESNGTVQLDKYPFCYYAAHNKYDPVVLENLEIQGFTTNPATRDQNEHETLLVLKHMATFHAVSSQLLKLTNNGIITEHPFLNFCLFEPKMKPVFGNVFQKMWELATDLVKSPEHVKIHDIMSKICTENFFENFDSLCAPEDPFNVLNMGDCWNNNIMFKYDENGKAIDMKFIDFQLIRFGTMIYDISYYLLTTTDHTKWKQNVINLYLQVYYESFNKVICSLRGVNKCPFTYDQFETHFYERAPLAFPMLCCISCIRFLPSDQFSDPSDLNEGGNFSDEFIKALLTMVSGENTKEILKNRIISSFEILESGFKALLEK